MNNETERGRHRSVRNEEKTTNQSRPTSKRPVYNKSNYSQINEQKQNRNTNYKPYKRTPTMQKKPFYKIVWFWLFVISMVFTIFLLLSTLGYNNELETAEENLTLTKRELQQYKNLSNDSNFANSSSSSNKADIKSSSSSSEKDISESTIIGLNEWWEVPGEWKLKIDSVKPTDDRNQFSDKTPEQVVIITYTYENLGYESNVQDLYLTGFKVVDSSNKMAETYPATTDKSPQPTPVGATCEGAQEAYGLTTPNGKIKINIEQYDSNKKKQKMTFEVPVE